MVDRVYQVIPGQSNDQKPDITDHIHDFSVETISNVLNKILNISVDSTEEFINDIKEADLSESVSNLKKNYSLPFYVICCFLLLFITYKIYVTRKDWIETNRKKEFLNKRRAE